MQSKSSANEGRTTSYSSKEQAMSSILSSKSAIIGVAVGGAIFVSLFAVTTAKAEEVSPEGSVPAVVATAPVEDDVSITVYADIVSGRDFGDQGFSLTADPVTEFGITACKGAWCGDLWRAESLVGNDEDHETDASVVYTDTVAGFTVKTKLGFFEVKGPEVWEVKLTVSHSVGERCEASVSYDVMWAGFNDHVTKGELSCSFPTPVENLSVDASAAVANSTWADSLTPSYQLGLGYEFRPGINASLYLKGYEGRDEQNVLVGAGIASTW